MIVKVKNMDEMGEINLSDNIAFAVDAEGTMRDDFSFFVASNFWSELFDRGEHEIGTVLTKKVDNVTFNAIVCYSTNYGWTSNQSQVIRDCINKISCKNQVIDVVEIGTNENDKLLGADIKQIVYGMQLSDRYISLNSSLSSDDVCDILGDMLLSQIPNIKVYNLTGDTGKIQSGFHEI